MSVPATAESNTPAPGAGAPSTGQAGATPAQEERANPTPASREETQERPSTPDYVRDAFARLRGYTQTAAPARQDPPQNGATETASRAPSASSPPSPEPERSAASPPTLAGPSAAATTLPPRQDQRPQERQSPGATPGGTPEKIVLTPEQLQRQVQAEADRILAKRQKDEQTRAAQEQERELRRTNPFEYARLMETKEAELEASRTETQRLTEIVGQQLTFYDRAILDTFVGALPEDDRQKVIRAEGDGIENRKAIAANTLKALRSRWTAEGRASARSDLMKDQTFIKEILARYGQASPEPESAPRAVRPAGNAVPDDGSSAMNAWMRAGAQGARATTGRV